MLHAKPMRKIRVVAAKTQMKDVIDCMHSLKLIHLSSDDLDEGFGIGEPFPISERIAGKLVKLRAMKEFLQLKHPARVVRGKENMLAQCTTAFNALMEQQHALEAEEKELQQEAGNPLGALPIPKNLLKSTPRVVCYQGTVKDSFFTRVEGALKQYECIHSPIERGKPAPVALFVSPEEQEQAHQLLDAHGYVEIPAPPTRSRKEIEKQLHQWAEKKAVHTRKIAVFRKKYGDFIASHERALTREGEKAAAPLQCATSRNAFIVKGWVPEKELPRFREQLRQITGEKVVIEDLPEHTGAPVALDNPKMAQPFEFLLNLYSLPKYTEVDPTFLMFLTFPLFFGFMLGDVGYGAITLVLFAALRQRMGEGARPLLTVAIMASLATILFGLVFGEAFGVEFLEHPILNRVHDTSFILLISILVGLVHLNFGLALGFYNVLRQHDFRHAIYEKGSWYLLELGAFLLAAPLAGISFLEPVGGVVGGVLVLAAVALLYKGEGLQGILEIPSLLSNVLSYSRLFAVGLASVALALIINELAGELWAQGGIMMAAGVLVLVVGHTINIALGIIGPFIHSLRLHYVEFFTKFYKGGGQAFVPFGSNKGGG